MASATNGQFKANLLEYEMHLREAQTRLTESFLRLGTMRHKAEGKPDAGDLDPTLEQDDALIETSLSTARAPKPPTAIWPC